MLTFLGVTGIIYRININPPTYCFVGLICVAKPNIVFYTETMREDKAEIAAALDDLITEI